ncbi:MAG: ribonuclease III [Lachnospiraceae bacterium]|jgi:ribonuclease-3|nr:ribonuclease III [Lachnospiraceae bacterium]
MLTEESINELEKKIEYCFREKALLKQALTHSSFVNEQRIKKLPDYERLEFLGDAVLELTTSDFLFRRFPDVREGELTKRRASIVCGSSLAQCAENISLGEYILMGRGEESTGGRHKENMISDVMEAVIGAIYLDGGFEKAVAFIQRFVLSDFEEKRLFYDSKTLLQEYVQKEKGAVLDYVLVNEYGPDHSREFVVEARVNGNTVGKGIGKTKKGAEQQAAYEALLAAKVKE